MKANVASKNAMRLRGLIGLGVLCVLFAVLSGCGPEAQTPVSAPPGSAAPPGGSSQDDYAKKMQEMQKSGK